MINSPSPARLRAGLAAAGFAAATLAAGTLLLPSPAFAVDKKLEKKLAEAVEILAEVGKDVPAHTRKDADCVSVLKVGKGGFIVGGTGGTGFLSCKTTKGTWSAPVVLDIGGPSAGAQIGGAKVEMVMVYTDVDDVEETARTSPVFQGQASATAGDAGVGVSAGANPEVEAGILTLSRSEGLYAGAVGEGLVVDPDEGRTRDLFGKTVNLQDVLVAGTVETPAAAKAFVAAVEKWAKGS